MAFQLPTTKEVVRVDIATFAGLLMGSRHRYITLAWQSEQTKRFYMTERRCEGTPAKGKKPAVEGCGHVFFGQSAACPECEQKAKRYPSALSGHTIERVYVAAVRNDFNFGNAVRNMLERQGESEAADDWQGPGKRTWGNHINHTPFVAHTPADDGLMRLYGHFLPGTRRGGKRSYFEVPGFTGYYVDGKLAADQAAVGAYKKPVTVSEDATTAARKEQHPVNARLDGACFAKIAGQWYLVMPATPAQIEALTAAALDYSQQIEAETVAAAA
jgi:hypothetical protein